MRARLQMTTSHRTDKRLFQQPCKETEEMCTCRVMLSVGTKIHGSAHLSHGPDADDALDRKVRLVREMPASCSAAVDSDEVHEPSEVVCAKLLSRDERVRDQELCPPADRSVKAPQRRTQHALVEELVVLLELRDVARLLSV